MSRGQAIAQAARNEVEPTRPYGVIIPDFYFDWLFPLLLPSEVAVLLYACRSILGYSQHRAERTDLISLSQIADGVRAGDHVYRCGTGLAVNTIRAALTALERANILYPVVVVGDRLVRAARKPRGRGHVTRYTLVERAEDIDWGWLEARGDRRASGQPEAADPDVSGSPAEQEANKTVNSPTEKTVNPPVVLDDKTVNPPAGKTVNPLTVLPNKTVNEPVPQTSRLRLVALVSKADLPNLVDSRRVWHLPLAWKHLPSSVPAGLRPAPGCLPATP